MWEYIAAPAYADIDLPESSFSGSPFSFLSSRRPHEKPVSFGEMILREKKGLPSISECLGVTRTGAGKGSFLSL